MGVPAVESLQRHFTRPVIDRAAPGFDAARSVWNGMIDRRPWYIVQPVDAQEVARAVLLAREHQLPLSIKGGGHSVAGHAVCDDGLMIDLCHLNAVSVDPEARVATVGGGAVLRSLDAAAQAHGLATTAGIYRHTGVAGLTLGGGVGLLMRRYGLTCDNLLAADVVTADGDIVETSEEVEPDLLWGLRGGGGNFGVVTRMRFRLHPLADVFGGTMVFRFEDAEKIDRVYCELFDDAPDELQIYSSYSTKSGVPSLSMTLCDCGSSGAGEAAAARFRASARPVAEQVGRISYLEMQRTWDDAFPSGQFRYWKSSFMIGITGDALQVFRDVMARTELPSCDIDLEPMGGAISRIAPSATAFADRDAASTLLLTTKWADARETDARIAWIRETFDAALPFSKPSGYINYMDRGDETRTEAAYSVNYERLRALKRRYDPENLFRHNANIRPD